MLSLSSTPAPSRRDLIPLLNPHPPPTLSRSSFLRPVRRPSPLQQWILALSSSLPRDHLLLSSPRTAAVPSRAAQASAAGRVAPAAAPPPLPPPVVPVLRTARPGLGSRSSGRSVPAAARPSTQSASSPSTASPTARSRSSSVTGTFSERLVWQGATSGFPSAKFVVTGRLMP
jgi:hypothetical protein